MEMRDNEFDDLFRSKLDGFETEASANVWSGIAGELNAGKRKKALLSYLSIAASIIVLAAAGILFIPRKQNVNVKSPASVALNKTHDSLIAAPIVKNHLAPLFKNTNNVNKPNETLADVRNVPQKDHPKTTRDTIVSQLITPAPTMKQDDKTDLAAISPNRQDMIKAVVPDTTTPLAIKIHTGDTTPFITKPAIIAPQLSIAANQNAAPVKASHKIRNLGDLINVVVAKVDKRKDKIIEFTHTDDNESTIAEVNLGIIKIRKDK
jgi:hypothetical protein